MDIKNKVILVTGSSSGIGRETAIQLAEKGANVIVTYFSNKAEGEKTLFQCNKLSNSLLVSLDVRKKDSIKKALDEIIKKFGKLDVLVNNSGYFVYKNFEDQSIDEIMEQVEVNLIGLMLTTKLALPILKKQKESLIINIASISGKNIYKQEAPYCATKFGVRAFTKSLALELPKNVKVYVINPTLTATKMTDSEGMPAKNVAEIIVKTVEEKLQKKSGDDIDLIDYF